MWGIYIGLGWLGKWYALIHYGSSTGSVFYPLGIMARLLRSCTTDLQI